MKTPISTSLIHPLTFQFEHGKVLQQPTSLFGREPVPLVAETHASLPPLRTALRVWAELIHNGDDDPVGHDRLTVHLTISIARVFISSRAERQLSTQCEEPQKLHLWIATVRDAFRVGTDCSIVPGFSVEKIDGVFAPLFDTAAALVVSLGSAHGIRKALWRSYMSSLSCFPNGHRFRLRFP